MSTQGRIRHSDDTGEWLDCPRRWRSWYERSFVGWHRGRLIAVPGEGLFEADGHSAASLPVIRALGHNDQANKAM